MASRAIIIWILWILYLGLSSGQKLSSKTFETDRICKSVVCSSIFTLHESLRDCVVVLGRLQISVLETTTKEDFHNISFPKLREVTDFVVLYRVSGLETLGHLFPNLARIRGLKLLNNYGLIIHDMPTLREIGLFSLLKIDRGGVIVWGVPQACYMETVNWKVIAPRSRRVISAPERQALCSGRCTCTANVSTNHCWNNMKCQRYLEGPDADKCNDQCFGCRNTNANECTLCRNYTYKGQCVSRCPEGTIILPENKYCITTKECKSLNGWFWNNTCVFECPIDYVIQHDRTGITCKPCHNCHKTCGNLKIQTIGAIQEAERCIYVNGYLEIHVRAIPQAMEELRIYLSHIQEVSDYILIYGSITMTSLDFLSSLRRIGGHKLMNDKYSLIVHDMLNMQTLFTQNVTKHLKVEKGTLKMHGNPMLCMRQIDKLKPLFPIEPSELDIPQGMNGYSGGCDEVALGFQIRVINETSAVVMFSPIVDPDVQYFILYVRLPLGAQTSVVPETCSESEWYAINVPTGNGINVGVVELSALRPASTYAVCIETYNPVQRRLARSNIANFTTPVGKPEPPFIRELAASSSDVVVIHWVDHKDYRPHITHYELDVTLIDIHTEDAIAKDHCKYTVDDFLEIDNSRHAVVMKPPPEYNRGCESMCGVLSTVTAGAMVDEYFNVCSAIDCNSQEDFTQGNSYQGKYVHTLVLNITSPKNEFQIGELAPYRDYRFRLRACTKESCSISSRGVVRTLRLATADIPTITYVKSTDSGIISVRWDPPEITNGPVLAYTVELLPNINVNELAHIIPQVSCVLANTTSLTVKTTIATKYYVRVCSTTLASNRACSDWMKIIAFTKLKQSWWWSGVLVGILLYAASLVIGCFRKLHGGRSDTIPLIDRTSSNRNESEPPSIMLSDFMPLYSIPLNDTQID